MGQRGSLSSVWGVGYTGWGYRRRKPRLLRLAPGGTRFKPYDGMNDYVPEFGWWIARSQHSVSTLQRKFHQGDLPIVLYERTGAIIELGKVNGQRIIALQLFSDGLEYECDFALTEAGIAVEETWDGVSHVQLNNYVV